MRGGEGAKRFYWFMSRIIWSKGFQVGHRAFAEEQVRTLGLGFQVQTTKNNGNARVVTCLIFGKH